MKSNKKVRYESINLEKKVKLPSNLGQETFKWALRSDIVDWSEDKMGFNRRMLKSFIKVIKPRFDSYISMTWADLEKRKSCHPMDVEKISSHMFRRLQNMFGEKTPETLYQIDVTHKHRIWGQKIGDVFCLLWNDEEHEVYPVKKKHT